MHCLNWILALTLLHYVTAAPTPEGTAIFSTSILQNIKDLQNTTCLSDDSAFYSVSFNQHDSIENALCCATKELKTVAGECFHSRNCNNEELETDTCFKIVCLQTGDFIQELLTLKSNMNPECIKCEAHPKTSYKEFLSDLEKLVKMFNTTPNKSN